MDRNEYMKEYRLKNKAKLQAYHKAYEDAHKEKRSIQKKQSDKNYRLKNRGKILMKNRTLERRFINAKSDAKKRNIEFALEFEIWAAEVHKPCIYCGDNLGKRSETSVGCDRLDNSKGYIIGNIASCCAFCNLTKGDRMTSEEMMEVAQTLIRIRKLQLSK